MKRLMTFKLRKQAEDAADFLMSQGIPVNIHGSDIIPTELAKFQNDEIEMTVQDINFLKAQEMLKMRASIGIPLPAIDIKFKFPWGKKAK